MRNLTILFFFILLSSCLTRTKEVEITESQTSLRFTPTGKEILSPGIHGISDRHVLVSVQREDSVRMEKVDVMDTNAKSLFCSLTVKYTIGGEQLYNIANVLTYPDHVENYKTLVVPPEIRGLIRDLCLLQTKDELLSNHDEILQKFREQATEHMNQYVSIETLKINFYEQTN